MPGAGPAVEQRGDCLIARNDVGKLPLSGPTATSLPGSLVASAPGEKVSLDMPLPHVAAVRSATERGMVRACSTARMRTIVPLAIDLDRVWGIPSNPVETGKEPAWRS